MVKNNSDDAMEIEVLDAAAEAKILQEGVTDLKGQKIWMGIKNAQWSPGGGRRLYFLYDPNGLTNLDPNHICAHAATRGSLAREEIQSGPVDLGNCQDGGKAWRVMIELGQV